MNVRFLRRPVAWAAWLIALAGLSACQAGAWATPTHAPATSPGPTPTYRVYAAPTATPRSIQTITDAMAKNPSFLASRHSTAGLQCQACHTPFPPAGTPTKELCLSCHTGSYSKLAALTPGRMNPHKSHMGELPCSYCHPGHETAVSQCIQCKHKPLVHEIPPGGEE